MIIIIIIITIIISSYSKAICDLPQADFSNRGQLQSFVHMWKLFSILSQINPFLLQCFALKLIFYASSSVVAAAAALLLAVQKAISL